MSNANSTEILEENNKQETSEGKVNIKKTKDNLLNLFSAVTPEFSNYYNFELAKPQNEELRTKGLPQSLKDKLKRHREKFLNARTADSKKPLEEKPTTTPSTSQILETKTQTKEPTNTKQSKISTVNFDDDSESDSDIEEITFSQYNGAKSEDSPITIEDETEKTSTEGEAENFIQLGETNEEEKLDWHSVPWITHEYKNPNPAIRLQEEIIDFYNFLQQTDAEKRDRKEVEKKVKELIQSVLPKAKVHTYGSFPVNLMLPGSDMDFAVETELGWSKDQTVNSLYKIAEAVKERDYAEKNTLEVISHARVPLVKYTDKQTGQSVDITLTPPGVPSGVGAVSVVRKFIKEYPAFKYLIMVIKYFLRQRGLNEVYRGGISSYATSLMLVNHLQMHHSNFDPEITKQTSLGTLLLDFLALYGIYFNYDKVAIDVRDGGRYVPKPPGSKPGLYVIDPTDETNNVTSGSFNWVTCRTAFRTGFGVLTSTSKNHIPSLLSRIIIVTPELVNRRKYIFKDTDYVPPKALLQQYLPQLKKSKSKSKKKKKSSKRKADLFEDDKPKKKNKI